MKRFKKGILTAVTACMAAALIQGSAVSAQATSTYADIGLEDGKTCTFQVTAVDEDTYDNADPVYVDGARLSLYKVADLNTDGTYSLTGVFQNVEGWDTYISGGSTASELSKVTESAENIVTSYDVSAVSTKTTGKESDPGTAVFSVNEYGIYLMEQTGASGTAKSYSEIPAVLVQLPQMKDGQWNYSVSAEPKMVINNGYSVTVRKRAVKDGEVTHRKVAGAVLRIISASESSKVVDRWTTRSDADHDSEKLKPGTYVLQETKAPDGYEKADDITFELTSDGKIVIDGEEQSSRVIVMGDAAVNVQTETPDDDGSRNNDRDDSSDSINGGGDNPDSTENPNEPGDDSSDPKDSSSSDDPIPGTDGSTGSVKTGDTTNLGLYFGLLGAAAAVIIIIVIVRKKKKR